METAELKNPVPKAAKDCLVFPRCFGCSSTICLLQLTMHTLRTVMFMIYTFRDRFRLSSRYSIGLSPPLQQVVLRFASTTSSGVSFGRAGLGRLERRAHESRSPKKRRILFPFCKTERC